jgi:hypothetical protein
MSIETSDWSSDPAENAAIADVRALLAGVVASLREVAESWYADPAGGFSADR